MYSVLFQMYTVFNKHTMQFLAQNPKIIRQENRLFLYESMTYVEKIRISFCSTAYLAKQAAPRKVGVENHIILNLVALPSSK